MTKGVACIFVSTDEGHVLIPALESLFGSDPPQPLEVVVVDNASQDGAAKEIRSRWPSVTVLRREQTYGLPANLNHGITATASDYVMLCNSDLIFEKGAVAELAAFLDSHPKAGMVAPLLTGADGSPRPSARRWYTLMSLLLLKGPWASLARETAPVKESVYADWDMNSPRQVDWVPCPATMVRRDAFDDVGLMDERFRLYFDDVDISLRMHKGGWQVWCTPDARIVHLEQRSSTRPFSRAWRWHLISMLKFILKHRGLSP